MSTPIKPLPIPLFDPGQAVYWIEPPDSVARAPYIMGSTVCRVTSLSSGVVCYMTTDGKHHQQAALFPTFQAAQLAIPGYRP